MLVFEIIGAKIAVAHMYSGGENMRGVKLFQLGKDPTDQMSWLSKDCCTFPNPADPSCRVAVVLCSTHNGKGGRNQLRASSNQAEDSIDSKTLCTKYFLNKGVFFTWKKSNGFLIEIQGKEETPLPKETAYPDRRNKMSTF